MSTKPAKIAGLLAIIAAVVMAIAGIATWVVITGQLTEEKIVVPKDAAFLPGAKVQGPFSAYAQAEIIKHHALAASQGKTYAELGDLQRAAQAEAKAAKEAGDTAKEEAATKQAADYTAQRTTVMNGSFLRASLFTSVLAYGVAFLVIGLAILFGLIGWALMNLAKAAGPVAEPVVVKE